MSTVSLQRCNPYKTPETERFRETFDEDAFFATLERVPINIEATFFIAQVYPTGATKKQRRMRQELEATIAEELARDGNAVAIILSLSQADIERANREKPTVRPREHTMRLVTLRNGALAIREVAAAIFGHDSEEDDDGNKTVTAIFATKDTAPAIQAALIAAMAPN